ncbi:hypothetical protein SAMN05421856_103124 [Chryseobacterium taichungense]|uniref:Uncharacterized protein n=1 Tax=Chryseobacterium taichungense TaxID=295069 RepID=A0A1H7Y9P4_9FLAO|nr:hypothetical protein SAMN05421856_103124 [Chryseobacterium taichungense]
MNFDFFDLLDIGSNLLNSGTTRFTRNKKKKTKYVREKISLILYFFSAVFFFLVFRNPLISENYMQSVVIGSVLGLAVSLVVFFVLHVLEMYYFKNAFQWLFFSLSVVSFFISVILWIYFKSGIFL